MKTHRRPLVHQVRRDAWVEINLGHIEHNIKELKKLLKSNVQIMAVVKADSYGHGSAMSASTLIASGVNMLGVASVDEGLQLRETGITVPILVLGDTPEWAFEAAIENDISLSVFTKEHLQVCKVLKNKTNKSAKAHIKINTGMNRVGLNFNKAHDFIEEALSQDYLNVCGIFTHLACAEDRTKTQQQIEKWNKIYDKFKDNNIIFHVVNTAGLISYPELQYNMVRTGIGINGMLPDLPQNTETPNLKQAMGLKARITYISNIEKGDGVSYGHSFVTNEDKKIATIPVGYADGVSRGLSNKIYGIINGQKVKQIGNITMDQLMLDVTNIKNVKKGDIITLLGQDGSEFINIDEWANLLNTINYEISCSLKVRLPRIYTR